MTTCGRSSTSRDLRPRSTAPWAPELRAAPGRLPGVVDGAVRPLQGCRNCGGGIRELVDLGRQPRADRFLHPAERGSERYFPLVVGLCARCTLVQATVDVPEEHRFTPEQVDDTRDPADLLADHAQLADTADMLIRSAAHRPDPFVCEIGSGDGAVLALVAGSGVRHLGVDPAPGPAARVCTSVNRFDSAAAGAIRDRHGPADVIYAADTICRLDDVRDVLRGVAHLMAPNGVFVCDEPYLGSITGADVLDRIDHAQTTYLTARSIQSLARSCGLELVDVRPSPRHSGAARFSLARSSEREAGPSVWTTLAEERSTGLNSAAVLEGLAAAAQRTRTDLVSLLRALRADGLRVAGYGAPSSLATLTNYCGIGPDLVPMVYDANPARQGRHTPGTHIPVRPLEEFHRDPPDVAVLFADHDPEALLSRERGFRDDGGRWVLRVPAIHVW
jgi:SAM-dependent methyltransferase